MHIRISKAGASNRMTSSVHKLKRTKFHLSMRKNFMLRVPKRWNGLPCCLPLETFKTHLDSWLCNLLLITLPWQGGWTRLYPEVFSNPNNSVIL